MESFGGAVATAGNVVNDDHDGDKCENSLSDVVLFFNEINFIF